MKQVNAYYKEPNPFLTIKPTNIISSTNYKDLNKDSYLILWGGSDIATEIYNNPPSKYGSNEHKSLRDKLEIDMFNTAVDLGIPIIGVCRGAQLITALTGGTLVQHIEDHVSNNHQVTTNTGNTLETNSCHHQMMVPTEENTILAWGGATQGVNDNDTFITYDTVPEMVYFPNVRALGIQGHIEWPSMTKDYRLFIENHVRKLFYE